MQGFDDDYVDIVDYIVRCTHKIWEEKGMGLIYSHYLHNVTVHTADGTVYGREQVLADSIQTLAALPDRKLFADAVVWTGDDQNGFHTSHHITSVAHNTGYSSYGPPTGKKVVWRAIANCFVKENRICEEWLLRDDLSVIRQLGFDENEIIARLASKESASKTGEQVHGEIGRVFGQTTPEVLPPKTCEGFDIEDFVRRSTHDIWNWRMFNKIAAYYADNYLCHSASGRELYGRDEFTAFVLSMLAMFPDARFSIDHLFWNGDEREGYRTAMRWSLVGTHTGHGIYGMPTGKRVRIWGMTQHVVKNGRFVEEWTLFNELALLKQFYLARMESGK